MHRRRRAPAAGRRAGGVVPVRRRRFEPRRRAGRAQRRAGKADPDVHHPRSTTRRSTRRARRPWSPGTSAPSRSSSTVGRDEVLNTYPELIRAAEGPVDRHVVCRPAAAGQRGPRARLQGGADRRRGRRVAGRLSLVQGPRAARLPRRRPRPAAAAGWSRAAVPAADRRADVPAGDDARRRSEAVGGHNAWLDIYGLMSLSKLRFFSPRDAASDSATTCPTTTWGSTSSACSRWHPLNRSLYLGGRVHAAGPAARRQGRPRGDELVGRDALPVPRRGRVRLPGPAAPALEDARPARQVHPAAAGRALAAAVDRLAAQGDVPRPVRQLPHDEAADVRRPAAQPGVAARRPATSTPQAVQHWRTGVPDDAAGSTQRTIGRDGPGRRGGDAAVAPHVHRRQPGGFAGLVASPSPSSRRARRPLHVPRNGPGSGTPEHGLRGRGITMSYALSTLWYERQRFLPGVLAVAFSACSSPCSAACLLGLFSITSIPIDESQADIWVGHPEVPSVDLGRPIPRRGSRTSPCPRSSGPSRTWRASPTGTSRPAAWSCAGHRLAARAHAMGAINALSRSTGPCCPNWAPSSSTRASSAGSVSTR